MEAIVKFPVTNGAALSHSRNRRDDLQCHYRVLSHSCTRRSLSSKASVHAYEVYYRMRMSYRHRLEKAMRRQVFLRGYHLSFAKPRRWPAMSSFAEQLTRVTAKAKAAAVSVVHLVRRGVSFLRLSRLLLPSPCLPSRRKGVVQIV